MEGLLPWAELTAPWIWGGALIFLRLLGCLVMMPDLGSTSVPPRIRLILALTLTVAIDAALGLVAIPPPTSPLMILPAVAREVVIGAALGLAVRLVYAAVEVAGDLVGINMALSLNVLFDAASGQQTIATGRLFGVIATLLFFAFGGHLIVVSGLFEHLRAHPVGGGEWILPTASDVASAGVDMMRHAVILSAPVIAITLVLNMAMGFIMRVVPSINLFGVGLGILMIGGFIALGFEGDALRVFVERELDRLPDRMFEYSGSAPPPGVGPGPGPSP